MNIYLHRKTYDNNCVIGELYTPEGFECFTLEDPWKNNEPNISCIPPGTYQVIIDFSNRFQKRIPHILNVPGREGIRIHCGNTSADTSGCILVGETMNFDFIGLSKDAFDKFFNKLTAWLQIDKVFIEIQA